MNTPNQPVTVPSPYAPTRPKKKKKKKAREAPLDTEARGDATHRKQSSGDAARVANKGISGGNPKVVSRKARSYT